MMNDDRTDPAQTIRDSVDRRKHEMTITTYTPSFIDSSGEEVTYDRRDGLTRRGK